MADLTDPQARYFYMKSKYNESQFKRQRKSQNKQVTPTGNKGQNFSQRPQPKNSASVFEDAVFNRFDRVFEKRATSRRR